MVKTFWHCCLWTYQNNQAPSSLLQVLAYVIIIIIAATLRTF